MDPQDDSVQMWSWTRRGNSVRRSLTASLYAKSEGSQMQNGVCRFQSRCALRVLKQLFSFWSCAQRGLRRRGEVSVLRPARPNASLAVRADCGLRRKGSGSEL